MVAALRHTLGKLHAARSQGVAVVRSAILRLAVDHLDSGTRGWEFQRASGTWARYPEWLGALFDTYSKGSGDRPATLVTVWHGRRYEVDFASMASRRLPRPPAGERTQAGPQATMTTHRDVAKSPHEEASLAGTGAGAGADAGAGSNAQLGSAARATPARSTRPPSQGASLASLHGSDAASPIPADSSYAHWVNASFTSWQAEFEGDDAGSALGAGGIGHDDSFFGPPSNDAAGTAVSMASSMVHPHHTSTAIRCVNAGSDGVAAVVDRAAKLVATALTISLTPEHKREALQLLVRGHLAVARAHIGPRASTPATLAVEAARAAMRTLSPGALAAALADESAPPNADDNGGGLLGLALAEALTVRAAAAFPSIRSMLHEQSCALCMELVEAIDWCCRFFRRRQKVVDGIDRAVSVDASALTIDATTATLLRAARLWHEARTQLQQFAMLLTRFDAEVRRLCEHFTWHARVLSSRHVRRLPRSDDVFCGTAARLACSICCVGSSARLLLQGQCNLVGG